MPNIRNLNLVSEIPLLTTFNDPSYGYNVPVTTDVLTGAPTSVTVNATSGPVTLTLGNTVGNDRSWLGTIDGHRWQVNTIGSYPGMTARALTA